MPLDMLANTSSSGIQVRAHTVESDVGSRLALSSCITFGKLFNLCSSVSSSTKCEGSVYLRENLLRLNEIINIKFLLQCFRIHRECSINGSYSLLTLVLPARTKGTCSILFLFPTTAQSCPFPPYCSHCPLFKCCHCTYYWILKLLFYLTHLSIRLKR